MQEGRAEWVTSLLFFHFVRITTPQAPKTRLSGGERAQSQELVRTGGHAVAARAGAPGIALHARRRAGGLGPAEEPLRLGAGGAAEGERRPGRRRGEVPPWPARVRPDALPRPVQPSHRAGRPHRDLLLSREASSGSLPRPAGRGPLVRPTPPPGACGPPPGPRADEQEAGRAGTRT